MMCIRNTLFRKYFTLKIIKLWKSSPNNWAPENEKFAFGFVVILAGCYSGIQFWYSFLWMKHIFFFRQMCWLPRSHQHLWQWQQVPGMILFFIGGFFLIQKSSSCHISFFSLSWPFILIGIGFDDPFQTWHHGRWDVSMNHAYTLSGRRLHQMKRIFQGSKIRWSTRYSGRKDHKSSEDGDDLGQAIHRKGKRAYHRSVSSEAFNPSRSRRCGKWSSI